MSGNKGSRFDARWLLTYFPFSLIFFNLVEKNLWRVKNFLSVGKMASRVYERENCFGERAHYDQVSWNSDEAWGEKKNRPRGEVRL